MNRWRGTSPRRAAGSWLAARCAALWATALCGATLGAAACTGTPVGQDACDGGACTAADPPRLYVTPPFGLGFDCITVGCNQTATMTLTNRGGGKVRIVRVLMTSTSSTDFSVELPDGELPVELGKDVPLAVVVRYQPTDAVADEGAVRISYALDPPQGPDPEPVILPLRTRSLGTPRVEVTQTELNFGYVEPGSSANEPLDVKNVSLVGSVLVITGYELEDGSDPAFNIQGAFPRFINSGDTLTINVRLSLPLSMMSQRVYRGVLHLFTNDADHPDIAVGLIATGRTEPVIQVDLPQNELDLGAVAVGGMLSRAVRIRNVGGSVLRVTPSLFSAEGTGFAIEPSVGQLPAIAPFEYGQVLVRFSAVQGGLALAAGGAPYLRLSSNDPVRSDVRVLLKGFGVLPNAQPSADRVEMGRVVVGWGVEPVTVTLRNSGAGPLNVFEAYLAPGSSNQLQVEMVSSLPRMLLPEDEPVAITLRYRPALLGPATGNLILRTDDPDQPLTQVPVSGFGISCEEGCPIPHATPDCAVGKCSIGSCESRWHNADMQDINGCECGEDSGGEVGHVCGSGSERNQGTLRDTDGAEQRVSGTLHSENDQDTYWFYMEDAGGIGQLFGDDYDARVELENTPEGVEFCIRVADHDVQGQGCGRGDEQCGLRNFRRDGSYGSEDGRDMTVRIRLTPGTAPFCANYTLRLKNG